MVKSLAQKLQRSLLRSFKILLVLVLFLLFYLLFGLTEPELFRLSRTAAITLICFPVVCVLMLKVYGMPDIDQVLKGPKANGSLPHGQSTYLILIFIQIQRIFHSGSFLSICLQQPEVEGDPHRGDDGLDQDQGGTKFDHILVGVAAHSIPDRGVMMEAMEERSTQQMMGSGFSPTPPQAAIMTGVMMLTRVLLSKN